MTLHDRVEQVTRNVTALHGHDAEIDLIQALRVRVKRAETNDKRAKDALANKKRLKKQLGSLSDVPKPSAALASKPKSLQERLEKESLEDVVRDQEWLTALFAPLETYLEKLNNKLLNFWQAAIDARVPDTESVFLQLERLGYLAEVSRARGAIKAIQALRTSLPTTDTVLTKVEEYLGVVQTALATLKSVPPALSGFLAKLAGKTATLVDYEELDRTSRDWLDQNDLIQRIRLNLT